MVLRRLGQSMFFAGWLIGLALLFFGFSGILDHLNNPNPDPVAMFDASGSPEVVLERNRSGHYVANGSINGQKVRFLVDTGATLVSLPLPVAQRLKLPLSAGAVSVTANGSVQTWTTRLDEVNLGGLVAYNVSASVLPNMGSDEVLLGMSYLEHLELIQRGDVLRLRIPAQ